MTQNVILLYPERMTQMQEQRLYQYRAQRKYEKVMTTVEAITTVLIGIGFLFCIGLTFTML